MSPGALRGARGAVLCGRCGCPFGPVGGVGTLAVADCRGDAAGAASTTLPPRSDSSTLPASRRDVAGLRLPRFMVPSLSLTSGWRSMTGSGVPGPPAPEDLGRPVPEHQGRTTCAQSESTRCYALHLPERNRL